MIYGLDLGTRRIAVACAETGWWGVKKVRDSGKHAVPIEESGYELGLWLAEVMPLDLQAVFYIERPFVGRPHGNVRTAIGQALTVGGVLAQAPGETHLIEQAEWKKAVVGSGNASKADIWEWLAATHPALSEAADGDQDVIDAFCISLYGRRLAGSGGV